ncbi:hypothetical protein DM860_015680 [Cuscuta australis]|uniref:DUF7794 domain-containing protein n=2 Tax=Cuscuta sect. Cleistogrammica TaxID=1824901 RepID=A0A328DGF1_9ASTE|nr:hypothetical protein DM860_015680 [Cuscuta australis]
MAGNTRSSLSYLIIISLLSLHTTIIDGASGVFFLDSPDQRYVRPSSSDETSSMSLPEVGAAVSVLLGFSPPATLSTKSSSKLNEVLAPNPFDRPRAVLLLEVTGAEGSHFLVGSEEFSVTHKRDVIWSTNTNIHLPGEESVSVLTLNEPLSLDSENELSEKELIDFASWLHGSYVNVAKEQFTEALIVPLENEDELRFDLSKKAVREFIKSLISLSHDCHKAMELHHDLFGSKNNKPELIVARFGAIQEMTNKHGTENVEQAMRLSVHVISKIFVSLRNAYKGEIVGVVVYNSASEPMLNVIHDSRQSARWLVETNSLQNATVIAAQLMVRRTVAWTTGIMLIIATLLGIYFLLNMSLTRDTLLYSNVKLD